MAPADLPLPPGSGLRYAGLTLRAVALTPPPGASGEALRCPAACALRRHRLADGTTILELEPLVTRQPSFSAALARGAPTFYVRVPDPAPAAGEVWLQRFDPLSGAGGVLAIAFSDGIAREPDQAAALIAPALGTAGDGSWEAFAAALAAAFDSLLLLGEAGQPLETASLTVRPAAGGELNLELTAEHRGDLRAAGLRRDHLPATLALAGTGPGQTQWVTAGATIIGSTDTATLFPGLRAVMVADLNRWFAPQFPSGTARPLPRFTRGNRVVPLVNGPAFFEDLFRELNAVSARTRPGFHLTGYRINPYAALAPPGVGPAGSCLSAVRRIADAGGRSCFLPMELMELAPEVEDYATAITIFMILATATGLVIDAFDTADGPPSLINDGGVFWVLAATAAGAALIIYMAEDRGIELNRDAVRALNIPGSSVCRLSRHPGTFLDNPVAAAGDFPVSAMVNVVHRFNVPHQKIALVRNDSGFIGWCGGIDLNPDRLDDARHLAEAPYHDVHVRVEGPAVRDLAVTFEERWARDGEGPPAFAAADVPVDSRGTEIVQVARTYHLASPGAPTERRLTFAPAGDRTILDTTLQALRAAREYVYIEDQYLTPPPEYVRVITEMVRTEAIRSLVIVVPSTPDQPYGRTARDAFVRALRDADREHRIVQVGYARRALRLPGTSSAAAKGRLLLGNEVSADTGDEVEIQLGPRTRLPPVPFWVSIDGELFLVTRSSSSGGDAEPAGRGEEASGIGIVFERFRATRGGHAHLVARGIGATPRDHLAGAAATVVRLDGIYVHSKVMLVDDVFASIGSANVNRRGYFSDAECNVFVVPEELRFAANNPVRRLRKQLWGELLDLPPGLSALLGDPVAASRLFRRTLFEGNRFAPFDATPDASLGLSGSVTLRGDPFGIIRTSVESITALVGITLDTAQQAVFDTVADPSSFLQTDFGPP